MRTCAILVVAIAAAAFFFFAPAAPAPAPAPAPAAVLLGGWRVITDVNDPHVQEVSAWAVAEHMKQANELLRFERVVSGEAQVVAGLNYRLDMVALNLLGRQNNTYVTVVYEQSWTKTRRLLSFDRTN